jgi:hypothetical protein
VSVEVEPTQTVETPAIGAGSGLTVTTVPITQPFAEVYVIFVVPAVTPVTRPEPTPIVAMEGEELVHEPPVKASVNVVVEPDAHTDVVPEMAEGVGYIVTVVVAGAQPVVKV